ncbi:MAG: hypothetical protein ACK4MF_03165 [Hyphomicrobiaceae bacterium]
MHYLTRFLAVVLAALWIAGPAAARGPNKDWVLLGEQTGGFRVDRDVFRVGDGRARISELRLQADRNDVHLMAVRLVYQNGYAEEFRVDRLLRDGEEAYPIDLRGERSFLSEIELTYRARPSFDGRAIVRVWGELAPRFRDRPVFGGGPDRDRGFDVIATERLGRDDRRVLFEVGRREGRFSAIRFRAEDGAVRLRDAFIVFVNGDRQRVEVEDRIEAGQQTRVIDLAGYARAIRTVEVEARASRREGGRARLSLLGREDRSWRPRDDDRFAGGGGGGRDDDWRRYERRDRFDRARDDRAGWYVLGEQKTGAFKRDTDVFRVGRDAGTFRAVRVYVERGDVEFSGLLITYGNGSTEEVGLRGTIREGHYSEPIELAGRERFIESITMRYRARLTGGLTGRIVLQGFKAGPYRGR